VKYLLTLPLALFPAIASAEATGGYNLDGLFAGIILGGIAVFAVIVGIIVLMVKGWKKRRGH